MQTESPLTPPPLAASDEDLVARIVAGEHALFEILIRRHNQRLFRTARAILKNDSEAEDAMQDAYVLAYQHLRQFEGRARFSTWLVRITVHEALRRMREARRFEPLDASADDGGTEDTIMHDDETAAATNPERGASDRELASIIEKAVDDLPAPFRAVFVMRAVEQMSVAEVAEVLELPPDTVKTRLHRARARIQRDLAARTDALTPSIYEFHLSRCDRVVAAVLGRIAPRDDVTNDRRR